MRTAILRVTFRAPLPLIEVIPIRLDLRRLNFDPLALEEVGQISATWDGLSTEAVALVRAFRGRAGTRCRTPGSPSPAVQPATQNMRGNHRSIECTAGHGWSTL